MFTGIIEGLGRIEKIVANNDNVDITIASDLSDELQIDQSIAHNGVCLTVTGKNNGCHIVTAIHETLAVTNLGELKVGDQVNLERCLQLNDRLDGHLVQGHVDGIGVCTEIKDENGSWRYSIQTDRKFAPLLISKGSVCINGVSLTVIDPDTQGFSVAIIPYTYEHTTFHSIEIGDKVNLEFDVIGKYLQRHLHLGIIQSEVFP